MVMEILENSKSIIDSIKKQTDYQRKEIESKINKRIDQYGGLLTEAGAAYAIARENDVETGFEPAPTKIKDIKKDQFNLRMKFNVINVYRLVEFEKKYGSGSVKNFMIKDDTGQIKFVIWNNKEISDKIKEGQEITVEGVYSKENNNFIEVHAGKNAKIKLGNIAVPKQQTVLERKSMKDAKAGDYVEGEGSIKTIYETREFTKRNGEKGKIGSLLITENGEDYRLVFWNKDADKMKNLKTEDKIKIRNLKTRINKMTGKLEFHYSYNSELEKLTPQTKE